MVFHQRGLPEWWTTVLKSATFLLKEEERRFLLGRWEISYSTSSDSLSP